VVLALDADGAGQEAMMKVAGVATKQRFELRVAALPPGSDPADVLERDGPEAVAALLGASVPFVRFRVERILGGGDRDSPEGRDRILEHLRPVFAQLGPGAMREELQREVVSRLSISEKLVERLLAGQAGSGENGDRGRAQTQLDAGERTERAFLELCIALPERGGELLGGLDGDSVFESPLLRAAAAHLRTHLRSPTAEIDDGELAVLLAELSVRAAVLTPVAAELEVERCQLELARVGREIASARGAGRGGVTALQREREVLKQELERWLAQALQETDAPRD
jgi:DNA primase